MPQRKSRQIPKVGSKFSRVFKGKTYVLNVVEVQGTVLYRLSGADYKTPTAAAKSITNTEVNGWAFWGIDQK